MSTNSCSSSLMIQFHLCSVSNPSFVITFMKLESIFFYPSLLSWTCLSIVFVVLRTAVQSRTSWSVLQLLTRPKRLRTPQKLEPLCNTDCMFCFEPKSAKLSGESSTCRMRSWQWNWTLSCPWQSLWLSLYNLKEKVGWSERGPWRKWVWLRIGKVSGGTEAIQFQLGESWRSWSRRPWLQFLCTPWEFWPICWI